MIPPEDLKRLAKDLEIQAERDRLKKALELLDRESRDMPLPVAIFISEICGVALGRHQHPALKKCALCPDPVSLRDGVQEETTHGLCRFCASAALDEALEVFAPFYLHGKALGHADIKNLAPLKTISKCGVSGLVGGAFSNAIDFFEKYGIRKT